MININIQSYPIIAEFYLPMFTLLTISSFHNCWIEVNIQVHLIVNSRHATICTEVLFAARLDNKQTYWQTCMENAGYVTL